MDGRNPFRTTFKPLETRTFVGIESSSQGFLGGAGFCPSTVVGTTAMFSVPIQATLGAKRLNFHEFSRSLEVWFGQILTWWLYHIILVSRSSRLERLEYGYLFLFSSLVYFSRGTLLTKKGVKNGT